VTRREDVEAALRRNATFVSAQQLHSELRQDPHPVGLTTVYRCLQKMVVEGSADVVQSADGESLYRACSVAHHHHIVCRRCGEATEIEAPEVEEWATAIARANKFDEVSHTVELFGVCWRCQQGRT
jgi:Fur family ferric uptake transcriptional regulator